MAADLLSHSLLLSTWVYFITAIKPTCMRISQFFLLCGRKGKECMHFRAHATHTYYVFTYIYIYILMVVLDMVIFWRIEKIEDGRKICFTCIYCIYHLIFFEVCELSEQVWDQTCGYIYCRSPSENWEVL